MPALPPALRHLHRVRWAVRATLTLGVAVSVAANILHAEHDHFAQAIAAWPPVALLLTVELISRVPVGRPILAGLRLLATAGIAGIAAYVSYFHMAAVVARYGEHNPNQYLLPASVDGLVVVASVSLVELAGRIRALEDAHTVPAAAVPATTTAAESLRTTGLAPRVAAHDPDQADGPEAAPAQPIMDQPVPVVAYIPPAAAAVSDADTGESNRSGGSYTGAARAMPIPLVPAAVHTRAPAEEVIPETVGELNRASAPDTARPQAAPDQSAPATIEAKPPHTAAAPDQRPTERMARSITNSETTVAVAYWHEREPHLRPAEIADKIGRSERHVRRVLAALDSDPPPGINGATVPTLADSLIGPP